MQRARSGTSLEFGDGSSAAPAMPMYCLAGRADQRTKPGNCPTGTRASGHYKVMASGFANCGPGRVTATRSTIDVL